MQLSSGGDVKQNMGNKQFERGYSGDRLRIPLFSDNQRFLPESIDIPSDLEELVDWAYEANTILEHVGPRVFTNVRFHAYVRRKLTPLDARKNDFVITRAVRLPSLDALELTVFLHANLVIVGEETTKELGTKEPLRRVFNVSRFSQFCKLLRRYNELMEARTLSTPLQDEDCDLECRICMEKRENKVLPCLHAVCNECHDKWLKWKKKCPFCLRPYHERKAEPNLWEVETFSLSETEDDVEVLETELQKLWLDEQVKRIQQENWVRLGLLCSVETDEGDFVWVD